LVQEELANDQHSLTTYVNNAKDRLNDDQRSTYETILNVVTNKEANYSLCMVVVESTKHLFGQQFCPIYEGKAKSCL
jgi:protein involved in ribonucleotide reduction